MQLYYRFFLPCLSACRFYAEMVCQCFPLLRQYIAGNSHFGGTKMNYLNHYTAVLHALHKNSGAMKQKLLGRLTFRCTVIASLCLSLSKCSETFYFLLTHQ